MAAAKKIGWFDTLAYVNKLESSGIERKQAQAQAEALVEVFNDQLLTKEDLSETRVELKEKIKDLDIKIDDLDHRLNTKIDNLEHKLNGKIYEFKIDIIKWVFGIILAQTGIMIGLLKFLPIIKI